MKSQSKSDRQRGNLTDEDIERYLLTHLDFFERNTDLLESLSIPHDTGGVVSLIERQVDVLRNKNEQLERKLIDLVQVARDNEGLSTRLHRLALGLMEAEGIDDVISTTKDLLRNEFPSTHVVIRLFAENGLDEPISDLYIGERGEAPKSLVDDLFDSNRPVCGRFEEVQMTYVFGDIGVEVKSAVLIPLTDVRNLGILALGSHESDRFHNGMGTLFLGYLGELVSRAVNTHLTN